MGSRIRGKGGRKEHIPGRWRETERGKARVGSRIREAGCRKLDKRGSRISGEGGSQERMG